MKEELKDKSVEELKALFEETITNYNPVPEEEKAEYEKLQEEYKATGDQLCSWFSTLGTERIRIVGNRIEIPYKEEEEDWETDDVKLVDKTATSRLEFVNEVLRKDFRILELREAFDKDLSIAIGQHVGNHYHCRSLSEIEALVNQATSITGKIDCHFVAAVKPIVDSLKALNKKMVSIRWEWARRKDEPENLISIIRSKWYKENPVESFLGKDVHISGFWGMQHIERFTDQFAVLSSGYRTKKENILLRKYLEELDWYKELEQKKRNLPRVRIPE